MTEVELLRVIELSPNRFELETVDGDRVTLTYDGYTLTAMHGVRENLSFLLHVKGLDGIEDYLHVAGYKLSPSAMVTLLGV
ncbi:MAG: hypothetical protein EBU08_11320 [Micrococcales bacterium]|nr:hypothetical protein [Micrococcales bacterium]